MHRAVGAGIFFHQYTFFVIILLLGVLVVLSAIFMVFRPAAKT